jgi:transposase-like protein
METTAEAPKTLKEVIEYFADRDRCFVYAVKLRWPSGKVTCPRCGSDQHSFISTRHLWFCKPCQQQFTMKVGTIFEDSPLGMDKWMVAFWLLVNCKNGISSYELGRDLGVTQRTAWFMLHRIRYSLQQGSVAKMKGEVEVDETFIGGKARNMHIAQRKRRITGSGVKGKTAVVGFVERGGKVQTTVVDNRKKQTLQSEVRKRVEAGAALYTDELLSYDGLEGQYAHQVINHAVAYVAGAVHTNTLENFWSLLKRGLHGTYVSVEPFHLFRYLDEQAFRYNERHGNDADRFTQAMGQVEGRRLTYKQVSGKLHDPATNHCDVEKKQDELPE